MNHPTLRFMDTLERLDRVFVECNLLTDEKRKEILLSWLVVKLHDQWNYRTRQVVLTSFGQSERVMLEILRTKWSINKPMPNNWEPDWHMPQVAIRAATLLNVPDIGQIQYALGAVTIIDDLRCARNAIVHNIPAAYAKYRNMVLSKYGLRNIPPHLFSCATNPNTGNTLYEEWCDELTTALGNTISS
jgi:hypothetical protein